MESKVLQLIYVCSNTLSSKTPIPPGNIYAVYIHVYPSFSFSSRCIFQISFRCDFRPQYKILWISEVLISAESGTFPFSRCPFCCVLVTSETNVWKHSTWFLKEKNEYTYGTENLPCPYRVFTSNPLFHNWWKETTCLFRIKRSEVDI
jgi:hypothetical protein